jgi:hypothetical protein
MDHYSILDQSTSRTASEPGLKTEEHKPSASAPQSSRELLRFPGEDGGKSLSEIAQRDLDATLQLLAERAQYITGASGATIALHEGGNMVCRASAGPSAPEVGAHLQVNSGLSGESVRTQQILRCNDAETDSRVNRESCRALGIASVVVMPLVREREVNGVFELLSGRAYAFEERDITALERLGEMIQTALEHVEAVSRGRTEIAGKKEEAELSDSAKAAAALPPHALSPAAESAAELESTAAEKTREEAEKPQALLSERGNIGNCEKCGFPVSEGRTLCLDCEVRVSPPSSKAPSFLSQFLNAEGKEQSWLHQHRYIVGAVLVAALAVAVLLWLR